MDSRRKVLSIALALFFISLAMLGTVKSAPAEDLITSLPGQPAVTFKQYGGYVTLDPVNGRALYYYFVEAEGNPSTKPLSLWLNGGPGSSSLLGAFSELGPFFAQNSSLIKNPKAWNQASNIIFLESPAGVGFSYSNTSSDYNSGDAKTAQDAVTFVLGWLKKFPEYNGRDFYLAGESYAGHYVPQLAAAIVKSNKVPGQAQINLKGIMIGNPVIDVDFDTGYSRLVFYWSHGLMSDKTFNTIISQCKFTSSPESEACSNAQQDGFNQAEGQGRLNNYDILADVCVRPPLWHLLNESSGVNQDVIPSPCDDQTNYMNIPEVQDALHARRTSWSLHSSVLNYADADRHLPMLPVFKGLHSEGLRIWVYSGDEDSVISFIGTRRLVEQLANETSLKQTSAYGPWFEGQQVAGWTESWGDLIYATARGAGHMVPAFQPSRALQLFTSFVTGTPLPPSPPS